MMKLSLGAAFFLLLLPHVRGILMDTLILKQDVPDIHDRLGKTLKSCFASRLNTLVITEDLGEVAQDLSLNAHLNVIVIDKNLDSRRSYGFFPRWQVFLLGSRSEKSLMKTLQKLKSSDLWNSGSTFFIVGGRKGGCDRASRILHAAWEMDLLASFYICEQVEGTVVLFTFNPFTKRATSSWEKVGTDLDNRWTLHRRPSSGGPEICENLEFDKTKHLDRYQVKAVALPKPHVKQLTGRNDDMATLEDTSYWFNFMVFKNMLSALKITAAINYDHPLKIINGTAVVEYLAKIQNGTYDVAATARYTRPKHHINSWIHPTISILTNHRDFLTPIEKIANFYSLGAVGLTWLAMLITWLVFLFRNNGRLFAAVLEVLRVLLSTGVLQPLRGIPIRIYLFGIWWLVIILNATFQGHISAFLTKPARFDVETLQDLKRYNYHIYVNPFYYNLLSNDLVDFSEDHIHVIQDFDCYEYVLKNSSAACIQNTLELFPRAIEHNLHLAPLPLNLWGVFFHRPNWPLAKKMDKYVSRLRVAGLVEHWYSKKYDAQLKKIQYREKQDTDPQIRKIRLSDLKFAFVLLAVGLSIATFFLLLEIYQAKKEPPQKVVKRRRRPRRTLN